MIYKIFLILPFTIIIPVIFHILSRKKIKEEFFPSLIFLFEREKRLRNYIRFEELILFLIRTLMILTLTAAGGLVFLPFRFFIKSDIRKIYDTSISMEGRIKKGDLETININGIADFEKTFEKYKYGIIVSDMQRVNFKSILLKNKRYKYFIPEIVHLPEENNSILDIDYEIDKILKVYVKIMRKGKVKNYDVTLYLDEKRFTKNVVLREGENNVEFLIQEKISGYKKLICVVNDELPFDNIYYKTIFSGIGKTIKILSDDEPKFLMKALKRRFNLQWIKDTDMIKKGDIVIIDNMKRFVNVDYLSMICSKLLVSLNDSIYTKSIEVRKVNERYSNIEDENMNIITEEPVKYNFLIDGKDVLSSFKNGEKAIVKNKNIIFTAFPLQAEELIYHTYYIPFLYSLINRLITDIEISIEIGDTIMGEFKEVITPKGYKYYNISNIVADERGFYTIISEDTIFVAVNPRREEYDLKILEKERMDYIFGMKKFYDGTGFFLFTFLILLLLEKIMERR